MSNQPDDLILLVLKNARGYTCLFRIEELLKNIEMPFEDVLDGLLTIIPSGWQYPDICGVKIEIDNYRIQSPLFEETPWILNSNIKAHDKHIGSICVSYAREMPKADEGPFLIQERELLDNIVKRLSHFVSFRNLRSELQRREHDEKISKRDSTPDWQIALNLVKETDRDLFLNICQRLLYLLCWSGIEQAKSLLKECNAGKVGSEYRPTPDANRPLGRSTFVFTDKIADKIVRIADQNFEDATLLSYIRKWIQEDRLSFLNKLMNQNLPLSELAEVIHRYNFTVSGESELSPNYRRGLNISLINKLLFERLDCVKVACEFIRLVDYPDLIDNMIYHKRSHGKIGAKGAGLFLAAQILKRSQSSPGKHGGIKVPKSKYLSADVLFHFLEYNNLSEIVDQKYKEPDQIECEYPLIIQTFRNCSSPPDILRGLALVLDDFGDVPLIVRSSSALEDCAGIPFKGKYESVFVSNQGSKSERLKALADAIAKVYASTFNPEAIKFRKQQGFLDLIEGMGVLIQQVVGIRIGDYFLPSYSGIAYSRNECPGAPKIEQKDSLIAMVPGLGTRMTGKEADYCPVLMAPGQIGIPVNVAAEEIVKHSPRKIDVLNLKTDRIETLELGKLLESCGTEYPGADEIISIYKDGRFRKLSETGIIVDKDTVVAAFEGFRENTEFAAKMLHMLKALEDGLQMPVELEFASDGKDIYLLQCRPQTFSDPHRNINCFDIAQRDTVIFATDYHIGARNLYNSRYLVCIDHKQRFNGSDASHKRRLRQTVSELNRLLPKKSFIVVVKGNMLDKDGDSQALGLTYSDVNRAAALVEITCDGKGNSADMQSRSQFVEDLRNGGIAYVWLYPGQKDSVCNDSFIHNADNILSQFQPASAEFEDAIALIDTQRIHKNYALQLFIDSTNKAMVLLTDYAPEPSDMPDINHIRNKISNGFSCWRLNLAQQIASQLEQERFGVKGFYVIGSTRDSTAFANSDIDILIHHRGNEEEKKKLITWLEGWSLCIDEVNCSRTGYRAGGLLDVHLVSDDDIAKGIGCASRISDDSHAALPLPLMK